MPSKIENVRGFAQEARTYQFRDCLALSVSAGDGGASEPCKVPTVYLSVAMVATLRDEIERFLAQANTHDGYKGRTVAASGGIVE